MIFYLELPVLQSVDRPDSPHPFTRRRLVPPLLIVVAGLARPPVALCLPPRLGEGALPVGLLGHLAQGQALLATHLAVALADAAILVALKCGKQSGQF